MSSPIALIIGAGSNVGRGVALRLKREGYKIAVGSRRPDVAEAEKNGFLPVSVDATDSGSIDNAFKVVRESYGSAPNVVVFNRMFTSLVQLSASNLDIPSQLLYMSHPPRPVIHSLSLSPQPKKLPTWKSAYSLPQSKRSLASEV